MSRRAAVLLALAVFFGGSGTAVAAFPGANGPIVYASDEYALNLDIFVIRDSGGRPVRLAKSTDTERNPAWSPNGDRIAYQRNVLLAGPEIWVMNADGSGKTRLGPGGNPAWSPDGEKIAYVGVTGFAWDGIHVMNDDGTGDVKIGDGFEPAWSPDGTQIAFSLENEVHVMDANGDNATALTSDGQQNSNPAWSPEGEQIAFSRLATTPPAHHEIAVMDANGANAVGITTVTDGAFFPAWSPDGTTIAFERGGPGSDSEIWIMDADGANPHGLTDTAEVAHTELDWQPRPVTLVAQNTPIRYGDQTVLTAHVYFFASTTSLDVTLYRVPASGPKVLLLTKPIDSSGDASFEVSPGRKTKYEVEWAGDAAHPPASDSAVVEVRAITRSSVSGHYARSGEVRLFHHGASLIQTGWVIPNHAGKKLGFYAQRRVNGNWLEYATAYFRIKANGKVTAILRPRDGRYRVRNVFQGDADHLGSHSEWVFARFG